MSADRTDAAQLVHLGVYGEIDMNLIDGSSVWLQSLALTLAQIAGVHVTVLLRTPLARDLLVAPLLARDNVTVVDPTLQRPQVRLLAPGEAVSLLAELDQEWPFDRLLLRGPAVADAAVASGRFVGRIWLYHVPTADGDPAAADAALRRRANVCDRLLCQTEAIAERVREAVPGIEDRLLLLPPMIPGELSQAPSPAGPLRRLLYAGKFSPEYCFLEMVSLFTELRGRLPGLEWDVAGDKIHNPPTDPRFRPNVEAALRGTEGLRWHGAVSRERVRELLQDADVALSIRHPDMDRSPELSTKVLEYGAAGCPVLLNRNPAHAELLGEDYPLLATDLEEARLRLLAANADLDLRADAQRRCFDAAAAHTFERVAETIAPHLPQRSEPPPGALVKAHGSPRLLIAGHQFNFLGAIRAYAIAQGAAVRVDRWSRHAIHDEEATAADVEWAEVIHCEWCLGAAIWCSRHKRDHQRLVVRFHRMELETAYPSEVDLDRVDAMVFVAKHVLEAACRQYGWPAHHPAFRMIPNAVDTAALARDKLPGAQFTLGLVGWVPMLKRIDRALEILERLRAHDDRFRLIVKGNAPWDYYWMAVREAEQRFYKAMLARIERSSLLRAAVTFEPFGEDIGAFLEKVGWILSLSDIEGHAVAPAEGMASGAVPVVLDRPGARDQYPTEWVHAGVDEAARAVLSAAGTGGMRVQVQRARQLAGECSWERLAPVWGELLGLGENR